MRTTVPERSGRPSRDIYGQKVAYWLPWRGWYRYVKPDTIEFAANFPRSFSREDIEAKGYVIRSIDWRFIRNCLLACAILAMLGWLFIFT